MIGNGNREKSTREEEELWAGDVLEWVADVVNEMAEAEDVVVVVEDDEVEEDWVVELEDSLLLELLLLLFPEVTLLAMLDEPDVDEDEDKSAAEEEAL